MFDKLVEIWDRKVASKIHARMGPSPAERRQRQLYSHLVSEPWTWMTEATPQHEWIDDAGKFIWWALFLTELGAGIYFFSLFFNNPVGMLIGWVICLLLGCTSFVLHTGHPERMHRAPLKFGNSWISRGVTFVSLFGLIGLINMILSFGGINLIFLQVIMGIICIVVTIYAGMVLSFVNGIPLWNTGLLPFSFIVAALWGGAEILLAVHIFGGLPIESVEHWVRILMPLFALIIILYLASVWSSSNIGQASVQRMLSGDLSKYFYIGVVLVGLVIPFIIVLYSFTGGIGVVPKFIYLVGVVCGIVGDLTIRYCILKGGYYRPIL